MPAIPKDHDKAEAAQHDRVVTTYADRTLVAAANDLMARRVWDKRDPEQRWALARRAALLREIRRRRLTADSIL